MRKDAKRDLARALRRDMTTAECMLWRQLRRRRLGWRFRRQHPIGPYVADFVCVEARLVIEVDGGQHMGSATDPRRDAFLRTRGFEILRFWNNDVTANLEGVCTAIAAHLRSRPHYDPPDVPSHGP
ncbi:endonuclease domain-containing protein [Luteimonas sp. R10]|uniref:endonuclease domain-containing protein n=1 Tax=Luteimonas sp. R10 TaxID=3108176 RepID=UPI003092BAA1|nr:endonuclease domain-containing protein [Luteimonas sp. R10]